MINSNTEILNILGQKIALGERKTINFNIANLYTSTKVEIPIIVERSKKPGPTILITAGIHGDEINGVEIVRQLIQNKINQPHIGTIICVPVLNVFGFLSMDRNFPDGRDLNRVFPGNSKGSLASQFAYQFTNKILPNVDFCIDFHTGGASRFNAPQIRVAPQNKELLEYATIFKAPFTVISKNISNTYRACCSKLNIPILLYEGGKSKNINKKVVTEGVEGTMRLLSHFGMLANAIEPPISKNKDICIHSSRWIRAKHSGLFHNEIKCGQFVEKGTIIATITDPYGKMNHKVKAGNSGYIINTNETPIVYQGDAIFHISRSYE